MAFEPLYVETWIYDTLHDDATLEAAMAAVVGQAPGYQQGVYLHLAPERDRVSGLPPAVPYIVVSREDGGEETRTACGARARMDILYRVTVWDSQNGAVAMDRVIDVADRVDELLHNQEQTATSPSHRSHRVSTGSVVEAQQGGEVFYGAYGLYKFIVRSV